MNEQDKRAVEGMARCGISLEGLQEAFKKFPPEEIKKIYDGLQEVEDEAGQSGISINCS